jgi:mannosylglucosylglycerate synthase
MKRITEKVDYVMAHNAFSLHFSLPLTAALWELAAFRPKGSVIAWCHDLAWTNPLYQSEMHSGYPWDLLRLPAPHVRYVVISKERERELIGLWGGGEADVIPNGIDAAGFLRLSDETREIVERYALFDSDLVLLFPTRITRRKNIELGIRCVAALRDRGVSVRFLVTGPTAPHHPGRSQQYLAELRSLAAELDVQNCVIFLAQELGQIPDSRTVAELYSVSDALLMPSSQEGFGLPVLEAGLARLPAVVSDIPILLEVGDDDVRRFSLTESADRIADEILEAVKLGPARLFRRVLSDYRWESIVERQILPLLGSGAGGRSR